MVSTARNRDSVKQFTLRLFTKVLGSQVLNFMIVGGIGYVLNIVVYWALCLYFGQSLYLTMFIASSSLAILSNYILNKYWTFRRQQIKRAGALRYFIMAYATIGLDMLLLFIGVHYLYLYPVVAAAIAIMCAFIVRYTIARRFIWFA